MLQPRRAALISLLLAAPALCGAQRGVGGFGRRGPNIVRESPIAIPKLVNPVNLLIEHRQEVALTDSQWTHLLAIKRTLDSTNAPLLRRLDSVQRVFRGGLVFEEPSRQHRDSVAEAKMTVQQATADLHDNYSVAKDKAFGLLDAQQYSHATELYGKAERAIIEQEEKAKKPSGRGGPPA